MRKLRFELMTDAPIKDIWKVISDIGSYNKYIKYCLYSKLVGDFKEGSSWFDWSTVVFIPLKINHEIIKINPNKKIVYLIKVPFGDMIQTISIEKSKKTKVTIDVLINFPNAFVNKTFGSFVYKRNKQMLEATIKNYEKAF